MTDSRKDGIKRVRSVKVPTKSVELPFGISAPPVGANREIHHRRKAPLVPPGRDGECFEDSPAAEPEERET